MKNRSELREIIMKVMYQIYILADTKIEYDINNLIKEQLEVDNDFVTTSINGMIKNQEEITNQINKYLTNWTMDRLSKVDQAILSLGVYELLYTETPSIVAINEAIELAKRYSDDKVTKMINAVLDGIYHSEEDNAR